MSTNASKFGKIGGTMVSAIVGQNPWETPHSAYLKLRNEVEPTPDNPAMARGRRLEPVVAQMFGGFEPQYRVEHNRRGTEEPEVYQHPKFSYLIGHPDRLLYDAQSGELVAGLEIKTANWSNYRYWGAEGTDEIPVHYLIQCLWYAGLANLSYWRVAVAFFDDDDNFKFYRQYRVDTDRDVFNILVERAVEFWERHVIVGEPPELNQVDSTTKRWVAQRFPNNTKPLGVASVQEEKAMANYLVAKERLTQAQQAMEQAETELKLAIGERDGLESGTFGRVTWRRSKDSQRVDYRGVVEELNPSQEVLARHTKTVEGSRRLVTHGLKVNLENL